MRQGDSFPILISDVGVEFSVVDKIEFVVGPYSKTYPGEVTYDSSKNAFSFPMSQTESMRLIGRQACEARIKYTDGQVEGVNVGSIDIEPMDSKAVI